MAFTKSKTPSISKQWRSHSTHQGQEEEEEEEEDSSRKLQFINSKSSSPPRKSLSVIVVFCVLFVFLLLFRCKTISRRTEFRSERVAQTEFFRNPKWVNTLEKAFFGRKNIKIGLINLKPEEIEHTLELVSLSENEIRATTERIVIGFDHVEEEEEEESVLSWESVFPGWIDEEEKWNSPKCPQIPMPEEMYGDVDVIVARIPCGRRTRDMLRLQLNLAVAKVAVDSSGLLEEDVHRTLYVVFVGPCGPMTEIFRCDDLLIHHRTAHPFRVYTPDLTRLKHNLLMPLGSCQLAPLYAQTGREVWRKFMLEGTSGNYVREKRSEIGIGRKKRREAYVTVLHSSEAYVCGAIALGQSILKTNTTKELVVMADEFISVASLEALRLAGWKTIYPIHRIRSPFSQKNSYNEWNYSKLRIWQLSQYSKLIFIDSDFLILRNIDRFFALPQLSAATNENFHFNSGLMIIEPSACLFEQLMSKTFELKSYNGGDQGFLNEFFTWWHKLPSEINHMKIFESNKTGLNNKTLAIHYFGLKPWMCYRDYDCNWDMVEYHDYASDAAHARWWQVYDEMPPQLQGFCGLTHNMDARITHARAIAANLSLPDQHWKIQVKDPRHYHLLSSTPST